MGVFLDGFDLFIIGVALPLIERDFSLNPVTKGLIAGAAVVGAFVGSAIGGFVTDKFGRKGMFVIDLIFFVVFAAASACAWNPASLIAFRFLLGVGIGADYPIGVAYIAENVPTSGRGKLVVGAFSFQAVGSLVGVAIGLILLSVYPQLSAWRWMLAFGVLPAIVVVWLRENLPESPRWYLSRGDYESASSAASKLLEQSITLTPENTPHPPEPLSFGSLFSPQYIRSTVLASVPWFLQDIATYGIGIFTPTILAVLAGSNQSDFIAQDIAATAGSIITNLPLILGFLLCTLLVDQVGRIPLQILGFIGMAIGLGIVAIASLFPSGSTQSIGLIFGGFMMFNFLMNLGPNSTTYLLSGEVFPTQIRATGAGFAAAFAKLGAVVGTFFFPTLQASLGIPMLLGLLAIASLFAALITALFQVNTTGLNLEKISSSRS
ncbi:MAG: MFS transporter [Cyanobacteria bacterium CRU_2_1]|nr:MFS transporter [Cyanobacteria bacterium RU_5_0]NJR60183.1 MFS transporter [Cyanobacteria bacterium CRU_2_1]